MSASREKTSGFCWTASLLPCTNVTGRVTSFRTRSSTTPLARKLPLCGVAMNTTVFTNGSGSKNIPVCSSSCVAVETFRADSGTWLTLSQKRDPLSLTMSLARRLPWRWPISTIWRRAASRCSESMSSSTCWSESRSCLAESRIGLLAR